MVFNTLLNTHTKKIILTSIISLFLYGCDNSDKNKPVEKATQQILKKETTYKGLISDKKKSIKSGEVKVTDSQGKLITSTTITKSRRYSVKIPADTKLPLILSFTPENDKSKKNELMTVAIFAAIKKYDINDLTTLIAKKAKSLGGYTHRNMVIAADQTVGIPDANKTSTGFRGDPTRQYGGWH